LKEFVPVYKEIGMILFYAWTDTQIINAINVKLNVYPKRQADLLIFRLSRVSEDLLTVLKNRNIFENVYVLEIPKFYLERKRSGIKEKAQALFLGNSYRKYFKQQLKQLFGEQKYKCFLISAFWSETLLIVRYLKSNKPEIIFYEEGLAAYSGTPKWLYRAVPNRGIKPWVRTMLYYGISAYTYRKYAKGIYLYMPVLSNIDYLEKWQIPLVRRAEEICCELVQVEGNDVYKNSDVIYIAEAPNSKNKYPVDKIYQTLDAIYEIKKDAKVVVKVHPIMKISECELNLEKYSHVYIDYQSERFEQKIMTLEMDSKVVITGNSTSALYMKWVYEKTPYVILLDSERTSQLIEYAERYVENYEKEKAYIGNSVLELREILRKIWL